MGERLVGWQRRFGIIFAGEAISTLTTSVLQMALIWYLTATTGSALVLSAAMLAGFVPGALLGIPAGVWVDRLPRRTVMIGADLFIAAVSLVLVIADLADLLSTALILAILAIRSIGTAFYQPAVAALTPLLVPTEHLMRANGWIQMLQQAGYIAGAALAGVLYPIASIGTMVVLDAIGALVASACVLLVRIEADLGHHRGDPDAVAQRHFWCEMREGAAAVRRVPVVAALVSIGALYTILWGPLGALYPLMSMDYFGGTTFEAAVAEVVFAGGMMLGGAILGITGGVRDRGRGIPASILLCGLATAASGLCRPDQFWLFTVFSTLIGASVPFYSAQVTSIIQERVPSEFLGRAMALQTALSSFAMPVGLVVSGLFAEALGVERFYLWSGVLTLGLALITLAVPSVRHVDRGSGPRGEGSGDVGHCRMNDPG